MNSIIILIVIALIVCVISLMFYSIRLEIRLMIFKNHLKSPNNTNIIRDINAISIRATKDNVYVYLHAVAYDYTAQDELNKLIDEMPRQLQLTLNMDFDAKKDGNYIVFIAKRKQKRWSLRGLLR